MRRRYPSRPLVGVAAIILRPEGRVLLVQRANEPGKGSWNLPGGALEVGERLEAGLLREVREEVGVQIAIGGLVGVYDRIVRDPRGAVQYHYVLIDYWAWYRAGAARAASDTLAVRWLDLAAVAAADLEPELKAAIARAADLAGLTALSADKAQKTLPVRP